ncbi:MAG: hypothetical protein ACP5LP_00390 [Candidatus Micrarchaeia archaeon]
MGDINSVKTYSLVALIFGILAMLGWFMIVLSATGAFFAARIISKEIVQSGGTVTVLPGLKSASYATLILIWVLFIISIFLVYKEHKIYKAALDGNITQLKKERSILWPILAIFLTFLLPGIFYLLAVDNINGINDSQTGSAEQNNTQ